ncbi:Retrotransposable element Tf2 [Cucumis melo var. makuwa]|uniref:Retrotransposable element Tf2 n=1 Tax=Cucumis melo var. makuwa TaxID=1194695 RepID=A0A5D3CJG9_CUCMM|nr:Retrotransposable element Tf2 [Cucumis melo var. makuwa]
MLHYKNRLVLTKTSSLIPAVLNTFHDSVVGGHSGFLRTYKRLTSELYWEGMKSDVKRHCEECLTCQRNKTLALSPAGLLVPSEVPQQVWSDISMDFVEGLPKARGFEVVLVVVDRLSKYGHFLPLKHPYTAKTVADLFVKEIVRLHGFNSFIVSNRDKIFLGHFWKQMFRLAGTKLNKSTAYHPQSDGQTEVRALGVSLFQVVYGRKPPSLLSYGEGDTSNSTLDEQLRERDIILVALREHLILAQQQMKQYADHKRRNVEYQVGDLVFLKIRPYRQLTLRRKRNEKLSPKYFGPYKILERIGTVAYKLDLPANTALHPVFHVSQSKKLVGDHAGVHSTIQYINENTEWQEQLEDILEYQKNKAGGWEVLICWKGLPRHEASWEEVVLDLPLSLFIKE